MFTKAVFTAWMYVAPAEPFPDLHLLERWPGMVKVYEAKQENERYTKYLWGQRGISADKEFWDRALTCNLRLWYVWDTLHDAHLASGPDRTANQLQRLRKALGDDEFFAGRMPAAHVTVYRER